MSKTDIKHTAKVNNIDYKIIEVQDKYIVAKPIENITPLGASGAHICFNTGNHHHDNFDGSKPVSINYTNTGSLFIASGAYVLPLSVQNNEIILLPKKPISELNYLYASGALILNANADGWVVALAKNKEAIGEVKEKIESYIKENIGVEEEWKLKTCEVCGKEYLKGTGITKIWLSDEDKYEDYPDWKYIGFEGPPEYEGNLISFAILCFCSNECCEKYFSIENNK